MSLVMRLEWDIRLKMDKDQLVESWVRISTLFVPAPLTRACLKIMAMGSTKGWPNYIQTNGLKLVHS